MTTLQPPYPENLKLKKNYLCMKKGTILKKISYDTYRCTLKKNCVREWTLDEVKDISLIYGHPKN